MKFKKNLLILSFLLVALITLSSVAAFEDVNNENITVCDDSLELNLINSDDCLQTDSDDSQDIVKISNNDSKLSEPKTIVVEDDGNNNHMNNPTIQNAINSAHAGDTIIINATSYVHCHIVIDKQLTIISNVGTVLGPCSNAGVKDSGHQGIFYITSKASGTVIDGFKFVDDLGLTDDEAYGILVRGASDVNIRNCIVSTGDMADSIRLENAKNINIQNATLIESINGIKIKNSENIVINGSVIKKNKFGVNIIGSSNLNITDNNVSDNKISGVAFSGNGQYLIVSSNNITNNDVGINITVPNYAYVLNNYIAFNSKYGVYVDYNITKVEIKGNFFNKNKLYEIFNDFHVKNFNKVGAEKLQIITNNYMIGYANERPIWHQIYDYKPGVGQFNYDAQKDVYVYVGSGGDYDGHQTTIYMGYIFELNEYVDCPNIYASYGKVWSQSGNYELKLSEITQVKKGIYSISIVDEKGNVATDLSSIYVTFYMNKLNEKSASADEGDYYKTVMMKNGTATVRFYDYEFNETGNVITAITPISGISYIDTKAVKKFNVADGDIPGIVSNTTIYLSNMTTYPNSGVLFYATLTDVTGKAIAGETLTFTVNGKVYNRTTNENGKTNITISESKEGTYDINVDFAGDDIDFSSSSNGAKIVVKKQSTKITSSNVYMIPKKAEYYTITLKDASGNVLANQKVKFKVNGKTYNENTNNKGQAKVSLKFSSQKTYSIVVEFAGNDKYKAVSKTSKITVKYSSKTAKLSTPTVTIPPKTAKYYTVTLKDANGKAISKQKVKVKINGKTYTKKTNSKGQVKVKVKFSKIKTYKVSASYAGNKIYKKASSSGKIKVAKTSTKITAPKVTVIPKESKKYTITLKTSAGKALSKQKLTIKVNGKSYSKKTNSKGQTSVTVKFTSEKTYSVSVKYAGAGIYKASKVTGKITVSKINTQICSYDRTFSKDLQKNYQITLKDKSGNVLSAQKITYTVNGESYTQSTDSKGQINIDVSNNTEDSIDIVAKYAGNSKYKSSSKTTKITISNKTGITFVDEGLPNAEIQSILDNAAEGSDVEFLGDTYSNIALTVKHSLNIYSSDKSLLQAKAGNPVIKISSDNVNITNLIFKGNSGSAVVLDNSNNVKIFNNSIFNGLSESKIPKYVDGSLMMPGYGIEVINSSNVNISENSIDLFESGVYAADSHNLIIDNNAIRENNYGIKYGFGVSNTEITNNLISENIGLFTMTVPEGPTGYGIFLNNSAVNVTINHNNITYNHIGISLDSNYSTGIVITQNTIFGNVLEGIRFNAGYDLAENATDIIVTDNAIYRNARGPSMMILGELSANPEGIYGNGLFFPADKLKLDANWYGTNYLITWDVDTGIVGYGTMCPRISTTPIVFNMTCLEPGKYEIRFYKDGVFDSNLAEFDLFATLNKKVEVNFNIVNGVGTFNFTADDYDEDSNEIIISSESLISTGSRSPNRDYYYTVLESEIPE